MEIGTRTIIIILVVILCLPLKAIPQKHPSLFAPPIDSQQEIEDLPIDSFAVDESINPSPSRKNLANDLNYSVHSAINITSDADFAVQAASEGWVGTGTNGHPYLIQGYNITFNGNNILINNVSAYFEIRDCLLITDGSMPRVGIYDDGIAIVNSRNGLILNNVVLGNRNAGIFLGWSSCSVFGNQVDEFQGYKSAHGISFYESSGMVMSNEILNCEQVGASMYSSSYVLVKSNSILNCETGIDIIESYDIEVDSNMIVGIPSWMGRHPSWGISLYNTGGCDITGNEIRNVWNAGIADYDSNDLLVAQNIIYNEVGTMEYGIQTEGSRSCFYTANCISNSVAAIHIYYSDSSIFSYNYLADISQYGIEIVYGQQNSFYGNYLAAPSTVIDDGYENGWDNGESVGNYWTGVSTIYGVSIPGSASSEDRYPLLILPSNSQMPIITCPPAISQISENRVVLTWVVWSSPGTYRLRHNGQLLRSDVPFESGQVEIPTYELPNGIHTFTLVVKDEDMKRATSTVILQVPGFQCLNDADVDEMPDIWELEHGLQPLNANDANEDADLDGLTNLEEYNHGTDLHSSDSDDDSIPDLWEVINGFDPLNPEISQLEYILYLLPYVVLTSLSFIPLWGMVSVYKRIPEEKKPLFLRGRSFSKSFWLKLIFAFGILLIFPTSLFWAGFLTGPSNDIEIESVFMFYTNLFGFEDPTLTFITPITLAAAIIVILPAVYQNRKLREHPANAPILDLSLAAIFGTIVFAYFMVREFPIGIELAIDSSPSPSLMSFSTLVIFVLILVPIFSREASLWGKEKVTEVKIAAKAKFHRFSKCSILGSLWCLAASVLPLACIVETEEDVIISSFISPSFEFNYVAEEAAFSGDLGDWMTISWDVHSVDDLMSYFALVVFQLIFAFYVLRYLRGITSRRRVMQLGILAVFIPFIYCLVTVSNPTMMPFTVAFPLPFVSLLGLLGLRFATPNEPSIERDGRHEYPETTLDDLRIQVPVIYYIKSRLMSWLRKSPKSEAE